MNLPMTSWTVLIGALLIQVACAESGRSNLPSAPSPVASPRSPPSAKATVWATVVERETGICLAGRRVEVVSGELAGQTFVQKIPCQGREQSGGVTLTDLPMSRCDCA